MCLADVSVLSVQAKSTILGYDSSYLLAWVLSIQASPEDSNMTEKKPALYFTPGSWYPGPNPNDFKKESENFQYKRASGMVFLLENRILNVRENKNTSAKSMNSKLGPYE